MKETKKYIFKNLSGLYEDTEIESFIYLIFNHLLGYDKKNMINRKDDRISAADRIKIFNIISRLRQFEPIQYIFGCTEFYGLKFLVKPEVLIPRGETEELVDLIIKRKKDQKLKVLDIGTGSGCIPVTLKKHLPDCEIWSCDISEVALSVALENAKINSVDIKLRKFDILCGEQVFTGEFDLIVSNPPYVTEKEKIMMLPNVLDFEPHLALFVPDNDPLKFYKSIVLRSKEILKKGGEIYFEINEIYGNEVKELLENNNFAVIIIKDINSKDRIVYAKMIL